MVTLFLLAHPAAVLLVTLGMILPVAGWLTLRLCPRREQYRPAEAVFLGRNERNEPMVELEDGTRAACGRRSMPGLRVGDTLRVWMPNGKPGAEPIPDRDGRALGRAVRRSRIAGWAMVLAGAAMAAAGTVMMCV